MAGAKEDVIQIDDLMDQRESGEDRSESIRSYDVEKRIAVNTLKRWYIPRALELAEGDPKLAAELSGLNYRGLLNMISDLGIDRTDFKP